MLSLEEVSMLKGLLRTGAASFGRRDNTIARDLVIRGCAGIAICTHRSQPVRYVPTAVGRLAAFDVRVHSGRRWSPFGIRYSGIPLAVIRKRLGIVPDACRPSDPLPKLVFVALLGLVVLFSLLAVI
jgi:hypothetical protein